jgi:hypothetical protein
MALALKDIRKQTQKGVVAKSKECQGDSGVSNAFSKNSAQSIGTVVGKALNILHFKHNDLVRRVRHEGLSKEAAKQEYMDAYNKMHNHVVNTLNKSFDIVQKTVKDHCNAIDKA